MKNWKLVAGIISIVLCAFVLLQSCVAGVANTLSENGEVGGSAGFIVAIMLLAGGIVSIVTRKGSKGGNISLIVLFGIGALSGYIMAGSYGDLYIWATWCLINLILAIVALIKFNNNGKKSTIPIEARDNIKTSGAKKKHKISIGNKILMGFATVIVILAVYLAYCTMNDINIPVLDYMMGNKNVKNAKISDLTGTWKSNEKGTYQEAAITKDEIVIYWVSPDSKSLYWQGTYTPPKNNTNDYSWESKADRKVTDKALLASQDDEKKFAYKDGIISYEATAMGVTKTVKLEKVK